MGRKTDMSPGQAMKEPTYVPKPEDYPVRLFKEPPKKMSDAQRFALQLRQDHIKSERHAIAYLLTDAELLNIEIYFRQNPNFNRLTKDDYLKDLNMYLSKSPELTYEDHMVFNERIRNPKTRMKSLYLVVEGATPEERKRKATESIQFLTPAFGANAFGIPVELTKENADTKEEERMLERFTTRQEMENSKIQLSRDNLSTLQNTKYPWLVKSGTDENKLWIRMEEPLLLDRLDNLYDLDHLKDMLQTLGISKEEAERKAKEIVEKQKREDEKREERDKAIKAIADFVIPYFTKKYVHRPPPTEPGISKLIEDDIEKERKKKDPDDKWWSDKKGKADVQAAVIARIEKDGAPVVKSAVMEVEVQAPAQAKEKDLDALMETLNKLEQRLGKTEEKMGREE